MMQVLGAGGLDLIYDEIKKPDEFNKMGYFEINEFNSKRVLSDIKSGFLKGGVFKVPFPNIKIRKDLIEQNNVCCIFMQRKAIDQYQSILKTNRRLVPSEFSIKFANLRKDYDLFIQTLGNRNIIKVDYDKVCNDPHLELIKIKHLVKDFEKAKEAVEISTQKR
jgi:hypothetical protein